MLSDTGFIWFEFYLCAVWSRWNVSPVAPIKVGRERNRSDLWVHTVIAYQLCLRPTHDSKKNIWSFPRFPLTDNLFSFADLLFQINITITLLQKDEASALAYTRSEPRTRRAQVVLFCDWVILQTRWRSLHLNDSSSFLVNIWSLFLSLLIFLSFGPALTWSRTSWATVCPCSTSRALPLRSTSTTAKMAILLQWAKTCSQVHTWVWFLPLIIDLLINRFLYQ